ncbi:hypothetical protein M8494_26995 [Serratia ureilytica]
MEGAAPAAAAAPAAKAEAAPAPAAAEAAAPAAKADDKASSPRTRHTCTRPRSFVVWRVNSALTAKVKGTGRKAASCAKTFRLT